MPQRRTFSAAVALVMMASLGGCGSGNSDEEQIIEAVEGYNVAVAEKAGEEACSFLAPSGQEVASDEHGYGGTLGLLKPAKPTCADAVRNRYTGEEQVIRALKFADVGDIEIREDEARAELSVGGLTETVRLVNQADGWKLARPLPPIDQGNGF